MMLVPSSYRKSNLFLHSMCGRWLPKLSFVDCLTVALFLLVLCTTGRSASTVEYLCHLRTTVSRGLGGESNVVPVVPTEGRQGRTHYPFGVLQRVLINSPSPKKRCMFILKRWQLLRMPSRAEPFHSSQLYRGLGRI